MHTLNGNTVCILLASYNGARHISEQIASIQKQTFENWILIASDDGSTDSTLAAIREIAARDGRVSVAGFSGTRSGGAKQNFSRLLARGLETGSNIFFLCDQDDVWGDTKLEKQINAFPQAGDEPHPVLVHSDLAVTDDDLNTIHRSMVEYMALNTAPPQPLNYLLSRNFVTGCATAVNRRLLERALPVPQAAVMHDWWLSLMAAFYGEIIFINDPLVRYRQHSANTVGAKGLWNADHLKTNWIQLWQMGNTELMATFAQGQALLNAVHANPESSVIHTEIVKDYLSLPNLSKSQRIKIAWRLKLRSGEVLAKIILWARLLTIPSVD